jgi:hypothetical protein
MDLSSFLGTPVLEKMSPNDAIEQKVIMYIKERQNCFKQKS